MRNTDTKKISYYIRQCHRPQLTTSIHYHHFAHQSTLFPRNKTLFNSEFVKTSQNALFENSPLTFRKDWFQKIFHNLIGDGI